MNQHIPDALTMERVVNMQHWLVRQIYEHKSTCPMCWRIELCAARERMVSCLQRWAAVEEEMARLDPRSNW